MKKMHCIGWLLTGAAPMFLIANSAALAADKVVVIPLASRSGETGGITTVTSAGQVWMDRNLGALRAAIKSDDSQAYGSLYQWGRLGDGHEYRESPVTDTLSPGNVPGHGHFIKVKDDPWDWMMASPNYDLWQESGINNPCPAGFRLPTRMEWQVERDSWGSNKNAADAFASPLKLVMAGLRSFTDGVLHSVGNRGDYWSSTADVNDSSVSWLHFFSAFSAQDNGPRAYGYSVRCIED